MQIPISGRQGDRKTAFVCAFALLLTLSACAPERPPRPLRTFNVVPIEQSHVVSFEEDSVELGGEAQRQLHAFARSHDISTMRKIVLEGGHPESGARQAAVAAALRAAGASAESITLSETALEPGLLRVTLHGDAILSLDCTKEETDYDGTLPWGCVNESNLLHMVEDPEDLLEGRSLGPGSAGRAVRAMQSYQRSAEPPAGGPGEP